MVTVSLEVGVPFPIEWEEYDYLQDPGDVLSILLKCVRDDPEEQQNVPLLWFRHLRGPMLVPV